MSKRVLVVCLGNVNRSATCAEVLRMRDIDVRSAGFSVPRPHRAAKKTRDHVLEKWGYDLEHHRATQLTQKQIDWADLIICMTESHVKKLNTSFAVDGTETMLLGPLVGEDNLKDTGFMNRGSTEFMWWTDKVVKASLQLCTLLDES